MLSCSRLEGVAYRFQPFVSELRSFLKQSNVAYGFPEHLLAFTDKLSSDTSLRAGVSAKLLEVIRESHQPVSHGELVELLLVTIGGANIDEDTPAVQKAERVLSQLVGEVMTSQDGLSLLEHPAPEPPVEPHPESITPAPTLEFAEPATAIKTQRPAPEAIAWASPPSYVWAALLCGVLLPPCMYFLSRPHEIPPSARPATTTPSMHSAPRPGPAPNPVLPALDNLKPLDLDFLDAPLPKKRSHRPLNQPAAIHTTDPQPVEDMPVAGPGANTSLWTGTDKLSRETDMPGRDLGQPEPLSPTPQVP